ncbi:MAG: A/G-specific adenine glycosylase [Desulfuromonadales bacterium]|nr:A/G-specific adenine glycosylase [Desulfuromonadales bacterium]
MPQMATVLPSIAPLLLAWYGRHGRDLPWRGTRDPYRIWLSEIMLQQTTVAAVIPYYERFLRAFPDVTGLAAAPLTQVLELWAGLGYYSRARNLHRAAQAVVAEHDGVFPATVAALNKLPGIGRSTAGAIVSIAYDRPAPILDGNVRRVLMRLFAWQEDPRSSRAERQLWSWAEQLTPVERAHDYAQAIMDLGATVCTPRNPTCPLCPLRELCRAHALGVATQLPVRRGRKVLPGRAQIALLLANPCGEMLVRPRPLQGLLGGMWEFPVAVIENGQEPSTVARRLLADLGLTAELREIGQLQQTYSHFRLDLTVFTGTVGATAHIAEAAGHWLDPTALADCPLHGVQRKALALLGAPPG